MLSPTNFDVFLCHNSQDKDVVRLLARILKERGLNVWFDEQMLSGERWQKQLQNMITNVKSAAVIVGKGGLGPWEELEMEAFLNECLERGLRLIPVLLPGVAAAKLPPFLKAFDWVDLRSGSGLHYECIEQLHWGITGVRPHSQDEGVESETVSTTPLDIDGRDPHPPVKKEGFSTRFIVPAAVITIMIGIAIVIGIAMGHLMASEFLHIAFIVVSVALMSIFYALTAPFPIQSLHYQLFRGVHRLSQGDDPHAVQALCTWLADNRDKLHGLTEGILDREYKLSRTLYRDTD